MASYTYFKNFNNAMVEQNITDNNEILSFESAKMEMYDNTIKTIVLYNYTDGEKRFYSLGLKENLQDENINILEHDLSDILKFKTAKVRREKLYKLIENYENALPIEKQMQNATIKDRNRVNEYFKETGWQLEKDVQVLTSDNSEHVAKYIGVDTTNMSYDDILDSLDVQNVWYDGEETHRYFIIVQ